MARVSPINSQWLQWTRSILTWFPRHWMRHIKGSWVLLRVRILWSNKINSLHFVSLAPKCYSCACFHCGPLKHTVVHPSAHASEKLPDHYKEKTKLKNSRERIKTSEQEDTMTGWKSSEGEGNKKERSRGVKRERRPTLGAKTRNTEKNWLWHHGGI